MCAHTQNTYLFPGHLEPGKKKKKKEDSRIGHLLIDCTVTVPAGHRLQHAAEEAAITVRLILCTAGHRVNYSGEHLWNDTI